MATYRLPTLLLAASLLTAGLATSGQAAVAATSRTTSVNNAFTVVGHSVVAGPGSWTTTFEVRNDSQEPATFDATIQLLDASTAVVGSGSGVVDQPDVLPGYTGFVHVVSTGAAVTDARLVLTDSHPVSVPAYRDLSVSPPDVTQPDPGDTDYRLTVTNVGLRPAAAVVVQAVTRDASGQVSDVTTSPAPDASTLPPGAARTVTLRLHGAGSTPMFSALGAETLSLVADGTYEPDTVGGVLSTTWHLGKARRCSTRIIRFTATSPPTTVAHATTNAKGTVSLRFRLSNRYLYSFLVDPSRSCGPFRFNDLALRGAISVRAGAPRAAHRGRRFVVHGTVVGARTGDLVVIQRKSGGPWVAVGRGRVGKGGRWSVGVAVTAPGRQTLRAFVPHTSFHFGAASASSTVVVTA